MNIYPLLTFDTAADQCASSLIGTHGVLAKHVDAICTGQAERLLPMIRATLDEVKLKITDLRGVAVTMGPGSFTGVRVGLAAAHGLALALGIPAIGIDSFRAFAHSAPPAANGVCVIIESRRAEKFWQVFDNNMNALTDPACDLPEIIAIRLSDGISLAGNAVQSLISLCPALEVAYAAPGPDLNAVGRLAGAVDIARYDAPLPLYVRPPDARITNA